jgi:glycosyltransferase involved in cell wall biosynthesis
MKVVVLSVHVPFVRGGAELLAGWLSDNLEERGHETELVRLPFRWNPPRVVLDHMLSARLTRIRPADRVVAMKFPAYLVPHENKVLWLLHQFRLAYELWATPHQGLENGHEAARVREAVHAADNAYLPEAGAIYTNSKVTSRRLQHFNGLDSTVLYPPLRDPGSFRCESYGDYVFFPSRITPTKRQQLLVQALAHTRSGVRAVIAGAPDVSSYLDPLRETIEREGLASRVELIPEWISEERKLELYANALAVVYPPLDEDSYGYVTMEAFYAHKAVVTCEDSGGTHELVEDGVTGRVVAPTPEALAEALDELADDPALAERLGHAGRERLETLNVSWDAVVERLTA